MSVSVNQTEGEIYCRSNGMELFVISNAEEYAAFTKDSEANFGKSVGPIMWINGRQDPDGSWYTYSPAKNPLHSGAVPTTNVTAAYGCLLTAANGTAFTTTNKFSCYARISCYCEYKL
jgi:hypothetical protein